MLRRCFSISAPQSLNEFKEHYARSISDPNAFWLEAGAETLKWMKQPTKAVKQGSLAAGDMRWFPGATLNASEECVERHVESGLGGTAALLVETDEVGDVFKVTYEELLRDTCRMANLLKSLGVGRGDTVAMVAGQVKETVSCLLACARIGAVQTSIFAGFSAAAVRQRIEKSGACVVLTADEGVRGGKRIPLKAIVDQAIQGLPQVRSVLVHSRTGASVNMQAGRDIALQDALLSQKPYCPAEEMNAEDPLFMMFTSGTTNAPKGVVHTTGGYLTYVTLASKLIFEFERGNHVHATVADIGWIAQQSFGVYGPLSNGVSSVLFESLPTYPNGQRYWEMVERLRVRSFFTAPTAIRALQKVDPEVRHDVSSLQSLGVAGEPINPAAWEWFSKHVGKGKVPVRDSYWLTESGCALLGTFPHMKGEPGAAGLPMYGVEPHVDENGKLLIKNHWPGIARTILGDHPRFMDTYITKDGYFATGDGASVDKDTGYVTISGRIDDVLNKAGHRMGTAEIESALVADSVCVEAAVVGVPDELTGQRIVAFCVVRDPEVAPGELQHAVRQRIGGIAVPDRIVLVSELPKTRSGKILRRMLRLAAEGERKEFGDISTLADESVLQHVLDALDKKV